MANVDVPNYNLPSFVDRVPIILIIATREVVIDDNVLHFLNMLVAKQQQQQVPVPQQQQLEFLSDINKGISNTFSFIKETDDNITPLGYGLVGLGPDLMVQQQHDTSKSAKLDSSMIENYKNARDQDMAQYMGQGQRSI